MSKFEISVKQIARETLPRLIDNLVFPNLVYKENIDGNAASKQGDTVSVRCPVFLQAEEFDQSGGVTPQNMQKNTVDIKLDHLATVDMQVDAIEAACDFDSIVKLFIEPAAAALAEKINAEGLELYRDIPYMAGTAGALPTGLDTLANASCILDENRVPAGKRCAVWSPKATAALKQIPALVNAEKCGTSAALRTGSVGKVFGIENYMSQAVCKHKPSYTGTLTIAANAENASVIKLKGSASGTLKHGDLLKIGAQTVAVLEDTAVSSAAADVKVSPAVTVTTADSVEMIGAHDANLVFHPDAFAFITRPLQTPAGVESYVTTYNGISLRVVRGYDMQYKREMLSMDVLYAFRTIYPELAVRYLT